jgi:hypothetical protein
MAQIEGSTTIASMPAGRRSGRQTDAMRSVPRNLFEALAGNAVPAVVLCSYAQSFAETKECVQVRIRRLVLGVTLLCAAPAFAIDSPSSVESTEKVVRVAASERYVRGSVYSFIMGAGYRELWETEIDLPLLDLATEGGGLTPTRRFGGLQTAVLGFKAENGRVYTFRSTDKDPSAVLDPLLRDTMIQILVQDQMAAQHPSGPPVAGVISEAAGVLTIRERMVVMPDDPRLGKFRQEFAGMVGTFFEYPLPAGERHSGFHFASEIIDHKELYDRLSRGLTDAVDTEAFLRARLLDILLGDFDRHRKQWRWARLPGEVGWQPIPEDRDMAFVRYDGIGPQLGYLFVPILQNYGPQYPFIKGLTLHGWEQDRWLLAHLEWSQWETAVHDLQARINDDVIERALDQLPAEYAALDGERLRADLRGRRDGLEEGARAFYEHLAKEVDVQASDAAERVLVERSPDGNMLVQISPIGEEASSGDPMYRRRFAPDDTKEVRIYLRGGDDDVEVRGRKGSIRLRVIAGEGGKHVDDSGGGGTRIYDEHHSVQVEPGPGTKVDRSPYVLPESDSGFVDVENVPPRDWGFDIVPFPEFSYQKDVGVFLGVGGMYTRYGFRKHEWSHRHKFSGGWATEANQPRVHYSGTIQRENSKLSGTLDLDFSGINVVRFYGFGNETNDNRSDAFYRVRSKQVRAVPHIELPLLDDRLRLAGGLLVEYSRTKSGNRIIDVFDPYGAGNFGMVGVAAKLQFDTRQTVAEASSGLALPFHDQLEAGYPTGGFLLDFRTLLSPPVWSVDETFGSIEGSVSGFFSPDQGNRVIFSLRAGGKQTFGKVPYIAAAFLGGTSYFSEQSTVRGYRSQRFAGEASVFCNAEIRVLLARVKIIVPTDIGVLAFGDVGRVFVDGESSDVWHASGGGGLWLAPLVRTNTISLSVAGSKEEALVYMRFGFHY